MGLETISEEINKQKEDQHFQEFNNELMQMKLQNSSQKSTQVIEDSLPDSQQNTLTYKQIICDKDVHHSIKFNDISNFSKDTNNKLANKVIFNFQLDENQIDELKTLNSLSEEYSLSNQFNDQFNMTQNLINTKNSTEQSNNSQRISSNNNQSNSFKKAKACCVQDVQDFTALDKQEVVLKDKNTNTSESQLYSSCNLEEGDSFKQLYKLGKGGQGEVQKVYELKSNQRFALKHINDPFQYNLEKNFYLNLQLNLKQNFDRFALKLKKFDDHNQNLFYQLGIISLKEFNEYGLKNNIIYTIEEFMSVVQFLINFLIVFSIKHGFYHSDIKPDNIVFIRNKKGHIKLKMIDFGIASNDYQDIYGFSYPYFHSKKRKYMNQNHDDASLNNKIPLISSKEERISIELYSVGRTLLYLLLSHIYKQENVWRKVFLDIKINHIEILKQHLRDSSILEIIRICLEEEEHGIFKVQQIIQDYIQKVKLQQITKQYLEQNVICGEACIIKNSNIIQQKGEEQSQKNQSQEFSIKEKQIQIQMKTYKFQNIMLQEQNKQKLQYNTQQLINQNEKFKKQTYFKKKQFQKSCTFIDEENCIKQYEKNCTNLQITPKFFQFSYRTNQAIFLIEKSKIVQQIDTLSNNQLIDELKFCQKNYLFDERGIQIAVQIVKKLSFEQIIENNELDEECLQIIALILIGSDELDKGLELLEATLLKYKQQQVKSPKLLKEQVDVMLNIADIYSSKNKQQEAILIVQDAVKILENLEQQDLNKLANTYYTLGKLFQGGEDIDKALINFQKAIDMKQDIGKEKNIECINNIKQSIGILYLTVGNLKEAQKYFDNNLELSEKLYGKNHQGYADTLFFIQEIQFQKRNYEQCQKILNQIQDIFNSKDRDAQGRYLEFIYYSQRGLISYKQHEYDEAKKYYDNARNIINKKLFDGKYAKLLIKMAKLFRKLKKFDEAMELANESLQISYKKYPNDNTNIGLIYLEIGKILCQKYLEEDPSKIYEGIIFLEQGYQILENKVGCKSPWLRLKQLQIGEWNYKNSDNQEALKFLELGKDNYNLSTNLDSKDENRLQRINNLIKQIDQAQQPSIN